MSQTARALLVAAARSVIGIPYVWGGATLAGFDCSGLMLWLYKGLGISIPRTAQQQYDGLTKTANPQPGDLVFFERTDSSQRDRITHVGIMTGPSTMIHAPQPGSTVREVSIDTPYWRQHFAGFGRVAALGDTPATPAPQLPPITLPPVAPPVNPWPTPAPAPAPTTPVATVPGVNPISRVTIGGVEVPNLLDNELWARVLLGVLGVGLVLVGAAVVARQ